jgi:hypothetical protein
MTIYEVSGPSTIVANGQTSPTGAHPGARGWSRELSELRAGTSGVVRVVRRLVHLVPGDGAGRRGDVTLIIGRSTSTPVEGGAQIVISGLGLVRPNPVADDEHTVSVAPVDQAGRRIAAGISFVRMRTADVTQVKQVTIVR